MLQKLVASDNGETLLISVTSFRFRCVDVASALSVCILHFGSRAFQFTLPTTNYWGFFCFLSVPHGDLHHRMILDVHHHSPDHHSVLLLSVAPHPSQCHSKIYLQHPARLTKDLSSMKLALVASMLIGLEAASCKTDFKNWHPPVLGYARSPCPLLNSLANHHVLPHDGRGKREACYLPPKIETYKS